MLVIVKGESILLLNKHFFPHTPHKVRIEEKGGNTFFLVCLARQESLYVCMRARVLVCVWYFHKMIGDCGTRTIGVYT